MSKVSISKIEAYEVFDSRGNPTVAAEVLLSDGTSSISYVPSGASIGKHEAKEKRDLEKNESRLDWRKNRLDWRKKRFGKKRKKRPARRIDQMWYLEPKWLR